MLTIKIKAEFVKFGQTFRKKLVLDYKKGNKHSHKNPHAIPLQIKDHLLNSKKGGDWRKIRQLQRRSLTPFGKFTKSNFKFDKQKLPFYNIPDLTGFQLKPYVQYSAPKISQQLRSHQKRVNKQQKARLTQ